MTDSIDWAPDEVALHDVAAVEKLDDRIPLVKAHIVGLDVPESNVVPSGDKVKELSLFDGIGALIPPYPPEIMVKLWEHSNALRQNVDSYAVNIDGHGHRFEPVIDLEASDAREKVSDAMFLEKLADSEAGIDVPHDVNDPYALPDVKPPTAKEIDARMKYLELAMRLEKARVQAFFDFACLDESFVSLRKATREDKEIMGNGFWEVLRNNSGAIAQFNHVPAYTVRLLPLEKKALEVPVKIKRTPLTYDTITIQKRFRRYVQVSEGHRVFFKEFGDPRVLSTKTGIFYDDVDAFKANEGRDGPPPPEATEILHFRVRSPRTPYGVPRWIGTLLSVLGSRQAEEVNFLYFENKSVPPLALLVSGGRLAAGAAQRIETFVEQRLKGRQNFHKILIIEAESAHAPALDAAASARTRIEIQPLTQALQQDALFQNYDERNIDKIGMSFRLPRLLRGDIRDFNRATADAALEFTEVQVFDPERSDFDWFINRKLLPELGVRYWLYRSNAPVTRNPIDLAGIITKLVTSSILTPGEARDLAQAIFNKDFKKLDDIWTKIPPDLLKAGFTPDSGNDDAPEETNKKPEPEPQQQPPAKPKPGEPEPGAPDPNKPKAPPVKAPANADATANPPPQPTTAAKRLENAAQAGDLRGLARDLVRLRDTLRDEEKRMAELEANAARDDENAEVIELDPEEFASLFETDPT